MDEGGPVGSSPRRLIEADLPIRRISAHARREKTTRGNPLGRLHTWWARKPLAACRAILCASLWPDPADADCPPAFVHAARAEMLKLATQHAARLSPESFRRFVGFQKNPKRLDRPSELQSALLDFIADFADPESITRSELLECARRLTQVAHESLIGDTGRPLVADPFAGGGSIPLEALRLHADAFATDLNPVAVLLNKIVAEAIPRHGRRLAEEARRWGNWMVQEAQSRLGPLYPSSHDGAVPVAWLWVRTVVCEGPRCGAEVPLRHTLWLAKNGRRSAALQFLPQDGDKRIDIRVLQDVRLACVVTSASGATGRAYRSPTRQDLDAVAAAQRQLEQTAGRLRGGLFPVPDEPLPPPGTLGFRVQRYGMERWGELFSPRQQVVMTTLVDLLHEVRSQLGNGDLASAVCGLLALAVDRQADFGNALNRWTAASEDAKQLFARQAIPMMWDYAEANPIDSDIGTFPGFVEGICAALARLGSDWRAGQAEAASATAQLLPDGSAHCVFTDPPYYDAIPYADLADFFYVWLRRTAGPSFPSLFADPLTPKDTECILDASKGKDRAYFESIMGRAMQECRRVLAPGGIGVVVFAHKSTGGWEAQLQAMVDAGWTITGSWPIDTELGSRLRAMNSAVLASSIHLVCRPRQGAEGQETVGDWRKVLEDLTARVHDWMLLLSQGRADDLKRFLVEEGVGREARFWHLAQALSALYPPGCQEKRWVDGLLARKRGLGL